MAFGDFSDDDPAAHRTRSSALGHLLLALAVVGLLLAAVLTPLVLTAGHAVSSAADRFLGARCGLVETPPPQRSTLLARDGKTVLARLFTQNRAPVRLAEVPHPLVRALIDTEDRRFYQHHGVDLRGLLRAAVHDLSGGDTQGGSTLTMQYVKQVRYYQAQTDAERQAAVAPDLNRKLENAKCALRLERRYSKGEILRKYLEIAFFGENSYGVSTAARTYFDRPVSALTVPQSAMLVGLLQAPSEYDPFLHPLAARERRNTVLANMAAVGDLTPLAAARYENAPLALAGKRPPPVPEGCPHANPAVPNAGFFCDYAVGWLREHGVSQSRLDTGGLHIVTTLDAQLQKHGQQAIWRAGLRAASDYILVMPSVDPKTGAVTSMITSRHYGVHGSAGQSSEPLFTAAYAGAGSTYKYFTAAAALTAGAPTSLQLSTPGNKYRTKHCAAGPYTVHNAGNYPDTMALRDALPQSSNTYFVALEDQFFGCRLGPVVHTALQLGMSRLAQPLSSDAKASIATEVARSQEPTFTLGQEPTSAMQLTGAFSAAANDGVFCPPVPIARVTDMQGRPVAIKHAGCHRVLDRYVARTLIDLMRHDTHDGTASEYFRGWYAGHGSDVAGKTGTDNDAADKANAALWFVGMTPHLVSAAALVNPQNPKQTVHGLPGLPNAYVAQDVFGAYASTYWLDAYGRQLRAHPWSWPSPGSLGGQHVPTVVGKDRQAATAQLRQAGFRVAVFPVPCASSQPAGMVAYQQPPRADPGAVVTICLSNGQPPFVYVPPPPPPPKHHSKPPTPPPGGHKHRPH